MFEWYVIFFLNTNIADDINDCINECDAEWIGCWSQVRRVWSSVPIAGHVLQTSDSILPKLKLH